MVLVNVKLYLKVGGLVTGTLEMQVGALVTGTLEVKVKVLVRDLGGKLWSWL